MKKLFILTSILALAACGGGSGGGGSAPAPIRNAVSSDTVSSNQNITVMASEVLVDEGGTAQTPTLSRSATARYQGQAYTSYRLDDVTFKLGGEDSLVKFELDNNGKIIALGKYDRSDDFTGTPRYALSEEGRFVRKDDTNQFTKNLYIYNVSKTAIDYQNGVDEIAYSHFNNGIEFMADSGDLSNANIKATLKAKLRKEINKIKASQDTSSPSYDDDIEALENAYGVYAGRIDALTSFSDPEELSATLDVGAENTNPTTGLRYADFGYAHLVVRNSNNDIVQEAYTPYVGGYDVLTINPSDLATNTVFTGTAIAGIDHKRSGFGDGNDIKQESVYVRDTGATLTMNMDGSSKLKTENLRRTDDASQHWYAVQIEKASATAAPKFTIGGTSNIEGEKEGAAAYVLPSGTGMTQFASDQWSNLEGSYVGHLDDNHRVSGTFETNIYGLNATDTEATSRFSFGNEYHSDDNVKHNSVAIYGAFGGANPTPVPEP